MFYFKLLFGFIAFWIQVALGDDGLCYKLDISDNIKDCDNFKNDKYDPSGLRIVPVDGEDGVERMGFYGLFVFKTELPEGYEIKIEACQETEYGNCDPAMAATSDLCSSLSQDDAPWKPVIDAMNVTSCPIPAAEYSLKEIVLSLDFAKDIMAHPYVGEYFIYIAITEKADTHACFTMGASISEYECDEDE